MVSPTSQAPGLPNSWLRPMVPPLVSFQTFDRVDLHGPESTLTQGNIEEWSVTIVQRSGTGLGGIYLPSSSLLFPIIGPPLSTLMPVFPLPLNISL